MGYNTWVSTFCPFFDWKVLRRIAVGHQERLEVIAANGWLSEGHALDYTFVATAADLETQSNGATHMGNDDVMLMSQVAHLKIINVSCPQQLLAVMKWIMEGGKGLIYLRLLRAPSKVLYSEDFEFSYGMSYPIIRHENPDAYIISSSRGVYESIQASELLLGKDLKVDVIDMPSVDKDEIIRLRNSARPVYIVEQNNGYLWSATLEILATQNVFDTRSIVPLNLTKGGEKSYIHSGTYDELAAHYGVDAKGIVNTILQTIAK
jgi:transketolase